MGSYENSRCFFTDSEVLKHWYLDWRNTIPRLDSVSVEVKVKAKMKYNNFLRCIGSFFLLSTCAISYAQEKPVTVGKNDWLFGNYAVVHERQDSEVLASVELIKKANQILKKANVRLVVIMIPFKMVLYPEYLPDGLELSRYMKDFNDVTLSRLSEGGVAVIDLKKAFHQAVQNDPQTLLYYKLDTHWTHSGTIVAAKTLQQGLSSDPNLKRIYDAMPAVPFILNWDKKVFTQSKIRDLVKALPSNISAYPPERTKSFTVIKSSETASGSLAGEPQGGELVLAGSSSSGDWLHFPDALRYSLQRNIFNFSINADAGNWAVLRGYLQSDHFQTKKPSLLIWEIPGQAYTGGPNLPWRLERYKTHPQLWLLQIAALTETVCNPVSVKIQVRAGTGSSTGQEPANLKRSDLEIQFDKPLDSSMYLRAKAVTNGTQQMTVEAWSKQELKNRMNVDVGTAGTDHALRVPIGVGLKEISQLKVTGISAMSDVQICQYSENWLAR